MKITLSINCVVEQRKSMMSLSFQNMQHHQRSLGGWSWAFGPYYDEDLTRYLDTPLVDDMTYLIDPKGDLVSV